jgi:enoyl-CoA hydratase
MTASADKNADAQAGFEELLFQKRDGVAIVTMNRPSLLNARNKKLRQELMRAFRLIDRDPEIVVAILTGAGERAFSVGMDLKEAAGDEETPLEARGTYGDISDARALAAVKKPVIAAINGFALGGGLELALCCDIRIASDTAQLGLPEALRGFIPGAGGTQRLPRLVGPARALEIMMTGERVPAAEALRIGLVNRVVPAAELMAQAETLARKIAAGAPVALRLIKEAVHRGLDMTLAEGLALEVDLSTLASQTEDSREGVQAFVEKRPPNWRGK